MTNSSPPPWEGPTKVADLMTVNVATIGPQEPLGFAVELMLWRAVRHLPVVENGKLVGVISDRDLLNRTGREGVMGLNSVRVSELMTTELEVANPEDDAAIAAGRMVERRINSLLIVVEGELVGILTSTDILAERARLFLKSGRAEVPGADTMMTTNPVRMHPDDAMLDAVVLMSRNGVRHMPVVDKGDRVVGMLSERNIRGSLAAALADAKPGTKIDDRTVGEAMTTPPTICRPGASVFELAHDFIDDRVGAVAVVDKDDKLLGIVSYVDMIRFLLGDGEP